MSGYTPTFRRTDTDRREPKAVVTARILGDPPADLEQRRANPGCRKNKVASYRRYRGPQ